MSANSQAAGQPRANAAGRASNGRSWRASHLQNLDVSWGHEPGLCKSLDCRQTTFRFMESSHVFPTAHSDHEPATDRSADSLVREFLGFDSCGHGCPRSVSWFMERTSAIPPEHSNRHSVQPSILTL